jgi:hypothetical protein
MMFQLQLLACGQRNLGSEYYHRALFSKIGLSTTHGSFADVVNVGTPIRFSCGKANTWHHVLHYGDGFSFVYSVGRGRWPMWPESRLGRAK